MHTLANSEGPDEMPQIAEFHQGLNYLLRQKKEKKRKKKNIFIERNTMDHPKFIVSDQTEESIGT